MRETIQMQKAEDLRYNVNMPAILLLNLHSGGWLIGLRRFRQIAYQNLIQYNLILGFKLK